MVTILFLLFHLFSLTQSRFWIFDEFNDYFNFLNITIISYLPRECKIANYLKASGFSDSIIPTMVCISKYESMYNCDSSNLNDDASIDYGLFKINSFEWCSDDSDSYYNQCNIPCVQLYNCQSNTDCAYIMYRQHGFAAWNSYQYHKLECDNYTIQC